MFADVQSAIQKGVLRSKTDMALGCKQNVNKDTSADHDTQAKKIGPNPLKTLTFLLIFSKLSP